MSKRMFVYEMPYPIRKRLCRILDASDQWEDLGGTYMNFEFDQLLCMRRKDSPTDALLTDWGNQNHTVDELFILLSRLQNYRAMSLLKEHVQEKYHYLLHEGEEFMTQSYPKSSSRQRPYPAAPHQPQSHTPSAPPLNNAQEYKTNEVEKNLNQISNKFDNQNKILVDEKKIQNVPTDAMNDNINVNQKSPTGRKPSLEDVDGSIPEIPFEELEEATNKWNTNCILGKGGFGTVYKGVWKHTQIAVKKLEPQRDPNTTSEIRSDTLAQSVNELKALNDHRHDNILSVYGYSIRRNICCLVYQYMANGSLDDRLHRKNNTPPLNWEQRLNIMTGTARAIQFIHSLSKNQNAPLVHGDIKSANILLDSNFEPRLGDFGLAREGPQDLLTHIKVSKVHGTRPYLPDEFLKSKRFSVKVDTYSYGVVLFEVATGLRAYDRNRQERFLKDYVTLYPKEKTDLIDRYAGIDICSSGVGLIVIGCSCVEYLPRDRPNMVDVLQAVERLFHTYKSVVRSRDLAHKGCFTPTSPIDLQIRYDVLSTQAANPQWPPSLSPDHRHFPVAPRLILPEPPCLAKAMTGMTLQPGSNIHQGGPSFRVESPFSPGNGFMASEIPYYQPTSPPTNAGSPFYPPPQVAVTPPTEFPPSVYSQNECDDHQAVSSSNIPMITELLKRNTDTAVENQTSNLSSESPVQTAIPGAKKYATDSKSVSSALNNDSRKETQSDLPEQSSGFEISLPTDCNIPNMSILGIKTETGVDRPPSAAPEQSEVGRSTKSVKNYVDKELTESSAAESKHLPLFASLLHSKSTK